MNTITYITSLLTFYLKGEIGSEQNFIVLRRPNTILALFPLGALTERIPVNQISSISTNFKLKLGKLIGGIIVSLFGLSMLGDSFFRSLLILILGINWAVNAFEIQLLLTTTSSMYKPITFLIFEKNKAELAADQINAMISVRLNDTNVREQTDRVVDAINQKFQ